MKPLRIGLIPLSDAAPIVAAHELGLYAEHGIAVELSVEPSWATVRDKLAAGALDAAQLLAPMALATSLGVGPLAGEIVTALSLGLGGNAITLSNGLFERLAAPPASAAEAARALAAVVAERRAAGAPPLRLASVFPYSMHEYELRYWLASAGIAPGRDVQIQVVPPPRMVEALESGAIDGFCVGEPWSTAAVRRGSGAIVATVPDLWQSAPEKVLGVRLGWAERNTELHRALLRALLEAGRWCDAPEHRPGLARWLARWIGAPEAVVAPSLLGRIECGRGAPARALPDFHCFARFAAGFPWRSHAAWMLVQMLRWGQLEKPVDVRAAAAGVYRSDWYREAAAELGIAAPAFDEKVEGTHAAAWIAPDGSALGPDLFVDGRRFDCDDVAGHLAGYAVHERRVSLDELASAQRARR